MKHKFSLSLKDLWVAVVLNFLSSGIFTVFQVMNIVMALSQASPSSYVIAVTL